MDKLRIARRTVLKGALGTAAGAAFSQGLIGAAWAQNPFAPPPLEYPSLDIPGPGGLTTRDLLNRGYWPVPSLPPASGQLEARQVAENVHLITGAGANVLVVTTGGGAIVVDGGREEYASALLEIITNLPGSGPVQALFNTSWRPEYTGLNRILGAAGTRIIAHELAQQWQSVRVIHPWDPQNPHAPLPAEARANDVFRATNNAAQNVEIAGVQIQYARLPFAHTDSSLYVYFPQANVAAIGGVTNGADSAWTQIEYRGNWPEIDWWTGARGNQIQAGLQTVEDRVDAGATIVPAQGDLLTVDNLIAQREMFTEIMSGTGVNHLQNVYASSRYGRDEVLYTFLNNPDRQPYIQEWGNPTVFVYRCKESAYPTGSKDA